MPRPINKSRAGKPNLLHRRDLSPPLVRAGEGFLRHVQRLLTVTRKQECHARHLAVVVARQLLERGEVVGPPGEPEEQRHVFSTIRRIFAALEDEYEQEDNALAGNASGKGF